MTNQFLTEQSALSALWYAIRVLTGKEETAAEALDEIGCETWLPTFRTLTKPTKKRKPVEIERPLLPGYVLARVPAAAWHKLREAKGVVGWIATREGEPAPCRDTHALDALRDAERIGLHDHDGIAGTISPGDVLEILFGPLADQSVTFFAARGQVIEGDVEFFGTKRRVKIPAHHVRLKRTY